MQLKSVKPCECIWDHLKTDEQGKHIVDDKNHLIPEIPAEIDLVRNLLFCLLKSIRKERDVIVGYSSHDGIDLPYVLPTVLAIAKKYGIPEEDVYTALIYIRENPNA